MPGVTAVGIAKGHTMFCLRFTWGSTSGFPNPMGAQEWHHARHQGVGCGVSSPKEIDGLQLFDMLTYDILDLGSFARAELVFCEHKSFLRNHSPRATPPGASEKNPTAAAPCSGILQWHQHVNSKAHAHTTLTAAT